MINEEDVRKILKDYGKEVTVATLGGHSALDVCRGAKDEGLRTVVVCRKDRKETYDKYYKTRDGKGIVDEVIMVEKFSDLTSEKVQEKLRKMNAVFINSRYFWTYCNLEEIENNFRVPVYGTRQLVRKEERDEDKNQYFLLEEAGIKTPKRFSDPKKIDRLVIVKAPEAARGYERAFFFCESYTDYREKSEAMVTAGEITEEGLRKAVIEEFVIGAQINFNFFYSPPTKELELLGTDIRRQTNIDGLLRLTAHQQKDLMERTYPKKGDPNLEVQPKYVETGHVAVTVKESLLGKAYEAAEKFVKATQKHFSPGIIGPFALQGAITPGPPKEEFVVFDVSMRIPGSPGTRYTPYMNYLYGEDVSVGRRIAMEIRKAAEENRLQEIVT